MTVALQDPAMAPVVVACLGQPGLAMDAVRELLDQAGAQLVEPAAGGGPEGGADPDVLMLVEPLPTHWVQARQDDVPVVLIVPEAPDDEAVVSAVLAGADAVLHYDSSTSDVVAALEAVSRGESVLAPAQVRVLVGLAREAAGAVSVSLSRREGEILASIGQGETVKQTARALGISPKTVENLQSRLFRKLGVRNRAQAVTRGHELGLL